MTIFTDKAQRYVPRLQKDLDISEVQACGIFGNLGTETGGFTALQEKAPTVKNSAGGYGWMQWTGMKAPNGRRYKYFEFCKAKNLDPASDEANYQYLVHETLTDEVHSLTQLRKTTTIEAATHTFMKQNLRPGVEHLPARINYAKQAYDAVQNSKKTDTQVLTTGGTVGGGLVATSVTDPNYWPWIWGVVIVTTVAGWFWAHYHAEQKKQEIPTKKAKKNG